ncbi:universal stress protein [Arthrobacter sp. GCM10027362]|uniref:universal stress protein n=1 Tax=Arthrobacter sp. GCM10027362 TaxID=3273379 RepID=UPI00363AB8CE
MAGSEADSAAGLRRFSGPVLVGVVPRQHPSVLAGAAALAAGLGVGLVCAFADPEVYPEVRPDGTVDLLPIDPDAGAAAETADALVSELQAGLRQVPVAWEFRHLWGDPAQALHRAAEELDASLIVVGTRERGLAHRLEERVAGSVAAHLAHRQQRPVLVVPARDGPAG